MEHLKEDVEQITPNLIRYWLFDKKVVAYEPTNVSRETVDAWSRSVAEQAKAWPAAKPYYELHDMRTASLTPYNRSKAMELVRILDDLSLRGGAAIILGEGRTGEVMGFFINHIFSRFNRKIKRRIFTSMDDALAWLQSELSV